MFHSMLVYESSLFNSFIKVTAVYYVILFGLFGLFKYYIIRLLSPVWIGHDGVIYLLLESYRILVHLNLSCHFII